MSAQTKILAVGEEPPPLERPGKAFGAPGGRSKDAPRGVGKPEGRRAVERFAVINAFADFALPGLSRAEVAVWLLLWRDTKPDGTARTSQADLARRAGVNERTVRRALGRLARADLLAVVRRGGLRQGPSRYRVRGVRSDRP